VKYTLGTYERMQKLGTVLCTCCGTERVAFDPEPGLVVVSKLCPICDCYSKSSKRPTVPGPRGRETVFEFEPEEFFGEG